MKDQDLVERYEKLHPEWRKAIDKHYKDNSAIQETCPVEVITHCSYDYPMYILAVRNHTTSASRGYPQEIDGLDVDEKAEAEAEAFCDKYGIEWSPKWILTSLWG